MTKPKDPETLLKHALFLSNFPEYTLKIKKTYKGKQQYEQNGIVNHADMHKPPFKAHITAGGFFINLDDIDVDRSKVPIIMCDLMLKKMYPGNHHNLSEECSSFQYGKNSGQASTDNSFQAKLKIYNKQNDDNFPGRKKRLELAWSQSDSVVEYAEAVDYKDIIGGEATDWLEVLSSLCNMQKLKVDYKIEFDGTKAADVKRLQSKFDIYHKCQVGTSDPTKERKGKQSPILTITGEQIRETDKIDKLELMREMAKSVLQSMEWHGLIPEVDYVNWDIVRSDMRQEIVKKERANKKLCEQNGFDEAEVESDDEGWQEDLDFMADENSTSGSNFYYHFRKNGKSREPLLKEIGASEHFEYLPPYKVPDCFLDYASWRDNGFDGKRDPLEKRKLRMMEDNRKMKPLGGVKRGLPGQNIYGGSVSTAQALGGTGSMYIADKKTKTTTYDPFNALLSTRGRQSTNFQPNYAYEQQSSKNHEMQRLQDKSKLDEYYARLEAKQALAKNKRKHTEDNKDEIIFKQHIENLPKLLSIRDNFKGPSMYRDQDSKHSQSGPLIGNRHGF